jgi:hypothetical protein
MSPTLVLVGDLLIAPLLAAVVYYTMRLHRRLETLRAEQKQLGELIGQFTSAADRADAASAHLKTAGVDTDKSVRALIARAESARDELAFLIDRADQASAKVGEARPPAAPPKRAPGPPLVAEQSPHPAVRSEAERELIHAMRRANGAR